MKIIEKVEEIFWTAKENNWDLSLGAPHHMTGYEGKWEYVFDNNLIALTIEEGRRGKPTMVFYRISDISIVIGKKELEIIDISAKSQEKLLKILEDKRRYWRF